MPRQFTKQPAESLDYDFDWSRWLTSPDVISTSVVTAESGITLGVKVSSTTVVKQFVSGGTSGSDYKITCRITTVEGRIDEEEITILVREF